MSDHLEVRGCVLPLSLHYSIGENTWIRVNDDGTVTVGMTDVAQNLAGAIPHAKPKRVGSVRKKGKCPDVDGLEFVDLAEGKCV